VGVGSTFVEISIVKRFEAFLEGSEVQKVNIWWWLG